MHEILACERKIIWSMALANFHLHNLNLSTSFKIHPFFKITPNKRDSKSLFSNSQKQKKIQAATLKRVLLKSYQAVYHVKPVEHDFSSFQTILLLFEWHIPWTNAQNMVFLDCTLMPTKWGIILTCMIMRLDIFNLLKIQAWFKFKVLSRKASGDANCNNKMFFHNKKIIQLTNMQKVTNNQNLTVALKQACH